MPEKTERIVLHVTPLPPDYPGRFLSYVYARAGVAPSISAPELKKELCTIDVYLALRAALITFKSLNKGLFMYQEDFRKPRQYSIEETVRHLFGMLRAHLKYLDPRGHEVTWHHMTGCKVHFQYIRITMHAFLEALQGLSFEDKFISGLMKMGSEALQGEMQSISGTLREMGSELKELHPFTKQQEALLGERFSFWSKERAQRFFQLFIVPALLKNSDKRFEDREIATFIAAFEGGEHGIA